MIRGMGLAIGLLTAAASAASAAPAPEKYSEKQREARFPSDLGADSIDVSSYPKTQQENYRVFAEVCSRCHTLARPINSPLATRADWKRFIARMHVRTKVQTDKIFTPEQAKAVVDFLAYDSNVRRVQHKAAFGAETKRLEALFKDVRAERDRVRSEQDAAKVKPYDDRPAVPKR